MDDAFGHWLAGFVDGEGHFGMWRQRRNPSHVTYACMFTINLRDDDAIILDRICEWVGHGAVRRHSSKPPNRRQLTFAVSSKAGCLRLVEIFDQYPLRAKKARDYLLWREAVHEWTKAVRGGAGAHGANDAVWNRMERLKAELIATRAYSDAVA